MAAFFAWLFQNLFHTEHAGRSAVHRESKSSAFAGLSFAVRSQRFAADASATSAERRQPLVNGGSA
jgi:hypothetical protein